MPSPFLRGKVARAALRRVTNEGCSVFIICRSAYHKDDIPSSGAPRQLPPQGEAMHRAVFFPAFAFYTRSLRLVAFTGIPKSIEELFGKRSGRRCGRGGKQSAPSAMAPWCERSLPHHVTLSSSSHAYAASILPNGKMLDLQGGSSSSQKSRCAAIFGSPVFSRSRMGLFQM